MTSSCAGACCAVFPMRRLDAVTLEGDERDAAFIRDMRIPLTREQAVERYARLGYGELPEYPEDKYELFTCRHWDEETRLCTVYDQRPGMCRDYPYPGRGCDRGCGYALSQADNEAIAERDDKGWVWDVEAQGWRPRSTSEYVWDAERGVLRDRSER